ncbi:MAG: hypothetical protein EI684_10615 [Candidatus Viridilinea halotolerans]|uniref:Uncharacterized protein n=1 Tax=Candidatus Viridilinea halotolerans TaxID=2491704 RepID=A0A426TZY8_9CHLR|nr:MAG: hypothetical protein EI684_10615 [Candidatus Viridilinea halotolerans]
MKHYVFSAIVFQIIFLELQDWMGVFGEGFALPEPLPWMGVFGEGFALPEPLLFEVFYLNNYQERAKLALALRHKQRRV